MSTKRIHPVLSGLAVVTLYFGFLYCLPQRDNPSIEEKLNKGTISYTEIESHLRWERVATKTDGPSNWQASYRTVPFVACWNSRIDPNDHVNIYTSVASFFPENYMAAAQLLCKEYAANEAGPWQ